MEQFNHFLITRFNLNFGAKEWTQDKNQISTLTDEWMIARLAIFRKYCLPSVSNQTNKNFRWLIFFDEATKQVHREIIKEMLANFSFIHTIFIPGASFKIKHLQQIKLLLQQNSKYLITTRIDNDDVIHERFIEKIQTNFNCQDYMAVNFVKLYTLDIVENQALKVNYAFSGHFISLIEKVDEINKIVGCYSKGDRYWNKKGEIIQIVDDIYCMELIHNTNVINIVRGFPVLVRRNLKAFHLDWHLNTSISSILEFFSIRTPWRKWLYLVLKIY